MTNLADLTLSVRIIWLSWTLNEEVVAEVNHGGGIDLLEDVSKER